MLSTSLRLNFCGLKIIHIPHPHYHPRIIGHTLKNKQKSMCVCIHEIIRVTIMKMKMNMNNSRIHEKVKQQKKRCLFKKTCIQLKLL